MEAHEASSIYSEEKAKLLRSVMENVETSNEELEQFMTSLQIDPSMFEQAPDRLPQDLLEKCAAMSVRTNAIKDLVGAMSGVSGLATETELGIKEIQDMLAEDAQKTQDFEKQFGKKMTSSVLPGLAKDCEGHAEKHAQGSQLNASLHTAMNAHIANLKLLALPPDHLQAQLPPPQAPKSAEDEEVMADMRRLLSKVEEMKVQRASLEKQFREDIHNDDITTVLMATHSTKDSIYKDQLKKHDTLIGYIGQNLNAQENILRALTDANARFASVRQAIAQQSAQREGMIKDLMLSFEKYEELLAKSKKGHEYYSRLYEVVNKTLERGRSECKVRQEERDLITSKYAPKVAPPSRPTAPKPGQPGTPSTPNPTFMEPGLLSMVDPAHLPSGMPVPGLSTSAALPTFEGPKLKDFLPFMKPQSFGPKASSPSPQVLAPGSPDPLVSGPPSLARDSPQPGRLPQAPADAALALGPTPGHRAARPHPAPSPTTPDVAQAGHHLPARPDLHQPQPCAAPPDVTANLPVVPGGPQSQLTHLPDVSYLSAAKDRFSSLPPHLAPQPGDYGGGYGGSLPGGYGGGLPGAYGGGLPTGGQGVAGGEAVGLPSTSESLAATASFRSGQMPVGPPGFQAPVSVAPGPSQNPGAQHPPGQPFQQPSQPAPAVAGPSGRYPYSQAYPSQQPAMGRPSPVSSPAPSPALAAYPQPQHSGYAGQGTHTLPPHLAQSATLGPGTPPQQGQLPVSPQPSHPPPSQQQQQPYPQSSQHQYHPGGALTQQAAGPQYQQTLPAAAQQQPGVPAPPRPAGPGLSQAGPQAPHSMHAYTQPHHPPPQPQPTHQPPSTGSSMAGASLAQQPYSLPSSSVPSPYSPVHAPASLARTAGHSQPTPADAYSSGQAPASQLQPQRPAQPQPVAPQPFQQPQGYAQLNQNSSHAQAQVSGSAVGVPPFQGSVPGPAQSVGQYIPGVHNVGAFSGAVPSQPMAQQQHPQQQTLPQPQHTFQPHLQPQQHRPSMSSYPAGYSQGSLNFCTQPVTTNVHPQPAASVSGQGQISSPQASRVAAGQGFPGQQGPQQLPQQQLPQQQLPQHQLPQQQLPQQQLPQQQLPQQQLPQQQLPQHQLPQQQLPQQQLPQQQLPQQQLPQQNQSLPFPQQQVPYSHTQPQIPQQQASSQHQQQLHQQQQLQQPFQQQYQSQQPQQLYAQAQFAQQNQPLPQHQFGAQPVPQQQQQQVLPSQSHPMQGPGQPTPAHHPPQQHPYPQYLAQQTQPPVPPPESRLIFPTPLQPSRAQPAGTVHPPAPTSQQAAASQATGAHPSLPPQGSDQQSSSSSSSQPLAQQAPSSHPPTPPAAASPQPSSLSGPTTLRQESSLDELLSSSPEGSKHTTIPAPIITPKVLTDQEKQQQKEEAMKKGAIVETVKDPYANSSVLNKLVSDVETFGKFVDDLAISILGVSRLDTVWKSVIDSQDHDVKKQSIAIARCYPMKNRDPDIMPYDETRVVLQTTKDDYINASWINDLAPSCPKFVATQAPLTVTMTDFWAMVYELGSEVIVQITSEYETSKKFPVYFPTEKGQQMEQGPMIVNLQSVKYRQLWTERNIYLKHSQTKQGRTVIHLQFKTWPVSGFPEEVQHMVRFISEVHSFYQQQRSLLKPVIVHCGNGVGRTGAFLTIYTGMQEMLHGNGLLDLPALAKRVLQKRKNLIHKKEQLKFCYDALLCFAEDFLKKRNILVQHPHFEKKSHVSGVSSTAASCDDIVLGSVNLHTLQQTVGRLHVHGHADTTTTPPPPSHHPGPGPQHTKDPQPLCSLPDLIQQQSRSDAGMGQGGAGGGGSAPSMAFIPQGGAGGGGSAPSVAFIPQGVGSGPSEGRGELVQAHSRSGSNASQHSLASLTEGGSSRASPQHAPSPFSHSSSPSSSLGAGGVSQSLADLQDPSKFTIGKGEQKKRFTKASFDRKGSGAGLEVRSDPADPISSLDAMWTIHKPSQADD
ncbi:hypothetical protein ACOMHN_005952 [Nucella lapillus]